MLVSHGKLHMNIRSESFAILGQPLWDGGDPAEVFGSELSRALNSWQKQGGGYCSVGTPLRGPTTSCTFIRVDK